MSPTNSFLKSFALCLLVLAALSGCAEPDRQDAGVTIALEDAAPYPGPADQARHPLEVIEVTPADEPSPGFSFEFAQF